MKKIVGLLMLFVFCFGNSQTSLLGKKAPEINPKEWVLPEGVSAYDKGKKLTVVDFWFTKCGPCVATIPELNALAVKNPEIQFLSVTFDSKTLIESFMKKIPIYYPIGIDVDRKVIKKFGVTGYPKTFVIDEKGIVIWEGHPIHLKEGLLKLIEEKRLSKNIELALSDTWKEQESYSINIKEHTLDMGASSSTSLSPFDMMILNRTVRQILNDFYKINNARIVFKDSSFLDKSYDVRLKLNKEFVQLKNSLEIFKFHYLNSVGLEYDTIQKSSDVHKMVVSAPDKLEEYSVSVKNSGTTLRYDNWEAKGASLQKLKNFLENYHGIVVELDSTLNLKKTYNFILSFKDFVSARKRLQETYGIVFKKEVKSTYFYEFQRK